MSACGSGKSSKGGGSKSKGKSSKGDALHKKVSIKTEKHHLTTLRAALRDELGGDRDVLSSFGAFTKYDREGLALDVHFRTGSTITDDELDWAEDLVHRNLKPLGHGWSPQALMDEMCDASSRFALVTERAPKSKKAPRTGKPIAFAHFRFSVEGDVRDVMEGVPVLLLRDLHVEPAAQRKGLGKHLCQLLELAARKNAMHGVMMLTPAGEPGTVARAFVASKLRGFECADETWAPSDPNLSTFAKSLVAKKPEPATPEVAAKTVPKLEHTAESPDSVLEARGKAPAKDIAEQTPAEATQAETKAEAKAEAKAEPEPAEPAPAASLFAAFAAPAAAETAARKMSFADFGNAAPDEDVSSSDEDDEEGAVEDAAEAKGEAAAGEDEADDILGQLVEMFVAENGRDPTNEEISQWVQTLKEAAEDGLQM
jgi:GNAT superfamily N-acetyltransferase